MTPIGPSSRWTMRKSSSSPRSRLPASAVDVGLGLLELVYGPQEKKRVTVGVGGELEQPRRVVGRGVAQRAASGPRRRAARRRPALTAPMLYTRRARAALRRARQPAGARGGRSPTRAARAPSAGSSAATTRSSAPAGGRAWRCCARSRRGVDPRQRRALDRAPGRGARQPGRPGRDRRVPRGARRATRRRRSRALPFEHASTATRASATPRRSRDLRSFLPRAGRRRGRAARRRDRAAAGLRPHPPALPPDVATGGIELVNPGSVGHAVRRRPARGLRARPRRRRASSTAASRTTTARGRADARALARRGLGRDGRAADRAGARMDV